MKCGTKKEKDTKVHFCENGMGPKSIDMFQYPAPPPEIIYIIQAVLQLTTSQIQAYNYDARVCAGMCVHACGYE